MTDITIIERLRAAMTAAGLSQQELGGAAALSKSAMSRVMSGQRKLGAAELGAMADALGVPVAELLGRGSTRVRPLAVAARVGQAIESADLEPAFQRVRSLLELRGLLGHLVESAPAAKAREAVPTTSSFMRDGQRLALQVREELDLGDAPVPDLPALLREHFGVDVSLEPLPADLHGVFITDPDAEPGTDEAVSVMLVNTADTYGRQRFTGCHELSHLLFADAELFWVDYRNEGSSVQERRANAFASAFLLPEGGVRSMLGELGSSPAGTGDRRRWVAQLLVDTSLRFGVSVESTTNRCLDLGLITDLDRGWARSTGTSTLVQLAGRTKERDELAGRQNVVSPPPMLVEQGLFAYWHGMFGIGPLAELWGAADAEALRQDLADAGWAPTFGPAM